MKKYLFGTIAILMAIAFSAFKTPQQVEKNVRPLATFHQWYKTTDGITVSAVVYNSATTPIDKTAAKPLSSCPDTGSTLCARGANDGTARAVGAPLPSPTTDSELNKP